MYMHYRTRENGYTESWSPLYNSVSYTLQDQNWALCDVKSRVVVCMSSEYEYSSQYKNFRLCTAMFI